MLPDSTDPAPRIVGQAMDRAVFNRWALPVLLFVVALVVRLIGLRWGLPSAEHFYSYHPDERQIAAAVASLDFFNGDFNPDFFNYPSLYIYLVYIVHFLGSGLGVLPAPASPNVVWPFLHNIILSGRFVTALLGAATVPLVFLIGRKIGDVRTGVLAALLLMFLPGHVQHSHFATVDAPVTFFVTLCLWFSVRAAATQRETAWRQRQLLIAAFIAGLAAATKYNGVLVLVAPLAAWFSLGEADDKRNWSVLARILALGVSRLFAGMSLQRARLFRLLGRPKCAGRLLRTLCALENRTWPGVHRDRQRLVVSSHLQPAVCHDVAGFVGRVGGPGLFAGTTHQTGVSRRRLCRGLFRVAGVFTGAISAVHAADATGIVSFRLRRCSVFLRLANPKQVAPTLFGSAQRSTPGFRSHRKLRSTHPFITPDPRTRPPPGCDNTRVLLQLSDLSIRRGSGLRRCRRKTRRRVRV